VHDIGSNWRAVHHINGPCLVNARSQSEVLYPEQFQLGPRVTRPYEPANQRMRFISEGSESSFFFLWCWGY